MIEKLFQAARQELGHVYWIGGPGCSGKSSVASLLGSQFNLRVYDVDEEIQQQKAPPGLRPLRQLGCDLWSWLGTGLVQRPALEIAATIMAEWRDAIFAHTVNHLLSMPRDKRILVEGLFLPESILATTDPAHMAVLCGNRFFREKYFVDRYGWFEAYINQAAAIDRALDARDEMDRQWANQAAQFNVLLFTIQAPPDVGTVSAQLAAHFALL